jgi:hypothetical protein
MDLLVVSKDTGEVKTKINPGDKIVRAKSIDSFKKKPDESTDEWKMEHFYKGHTEEIQKIMKELSVNEKAFLFSIAPYVGYEDCCLKYANNKDLTMDGLVEISGMCRSVVFNVVASLIDKDILYRGKNSKNRQYFVNPWLFCKGQRINKVLKTMFKNYRVRVAGNVRWGDLVTNNAHKLPLH